MALFEWIIFYLIFSIFWLWVVRLGGAEWLKETFISGFMVRIFGVTVTTESIKIFGWGAFIVNTILFIIGIFLPSFRLFKFI